MKPRTMGRYSGLGLILVTLGGAGMLLGSVSYAPDLNGIGGGAVLRDDKPCKKFMNSGADHGNSKEHQESAANGAKLNLRPKNNARRNKIEKKAGWVGVVENVDENNSSVTFPSIGPKSYGCIWFIPLITPDNSEPIRHVVRLYDVSGDYVPLAGIFCPHHHERIDTPAWETVPKDCQRVIISPVDPRIKPFEVSRPDGGWGSNGTAFVAAIKVALGGIKTVDKAIIDRIVARYGDEGPWYPCSDGCCRATAE